MVVAFATDERNGLKSKISHHFGRCPFYVFVEIDNGEVKSVIEEENPYANAHGPGMVPDFIASKKADFIVSGGMGPRAVEAFKNHGIRAVVGVSGKVEDVLKDIMEGRYDVVTPDTYDINKHDRFKED